jgi:hypothetical protein
MFGHPHSRILKNTSRVATEGVADEITSKPTHQNLEISRKPVDVFPRLI